MHDELAKHVDESAVACRSIAIKGLRALQNRLSINVIANCQCADRTHSLACCVNSADWLPPNLQVPYQTISVSTVLGSLTTQLQAFYRHALEEPQVWVKYLDAAELAWYDWGADAAASSIVAK